MPRKIITDVLFLRDERETIAVMPGFVDGPREDDITIFGLSFCHSDASVGWLEEEIRWGNLVYATAEQIKPIHGIMSTWPEPYHLRVWQRIEVSLMHNRSKITLEAGNKLMTKALGWTPPHLKTKTFEYWPAHNEGIAAGEIKTVKVKSRLF